MTLPFEQAKKQHDKLMDRIKFLTQRTEEIKFNSGSNENLTEEIAKSLEKLDELAKDYPML